jgi:glutathione peroxidase
MAETFHSFSVRAAEGTEWPLEKYKGQVALVVNVASACGFTSQYNGLEELYRKYKDKGFVILGFPCNQFGSQESGSNEQIQQFCKEKYNVTFPIMAKIEVNGDKADPVYKFLKKQAPGILGTEAIKWNFTKFLVDKNGQVVKRYPPQIEPVDIGEDLLALLS